MAQHDYDIANSDGATVRLDINSLAEAIASLNGGGSAPSVTFPFMWWADTTNTLLKIRNAANNAWVTVGTLDATGLGITFDISALTALTAPDTADLLALYDSSASAMRKITIANFYKAIDTLTALTAPDVADELVIFDASGTVAAKITLENFYKVIDTLTANTSPDGADEIATYKITGSPTGVPRKVTLANMLKIINTLTEDTSPDSANDFLVTYDASANAPKKVKIANIPSSAKNDFVLVQEQKTSGSRPTARTTGAYNKLTVTEIDDASSICTVTSGVIALAAGSYEFSGWAAIGVPMTSAIQAHLRLRDTSNSVTLGIGLNAYVGGNIGINANCEIHGRFTLSATTNIEIQYWATSGDSLTAPVDVSAGDTEVYTSVLFRRYA